MILIGLGGNLDHPRYGPPRATCGAALGHLAASHDVTVAGRSRWYRSPPAPASDQPWFVNAVVSLETELEPAALLVRLLATEAAFGRHRTAPNAARTLDLDLLAYGDQVVEGAAVDAAAASRPALTLPHPRLAERAFVLLPIRDLAPGWRHPQTGADVAALIAALPAGATAEAIADAGGAFGTEWRPPPVV